MHRDCGGDVKSAAHSPVDADRAQIEDAGGAHHHIQRDEDVTVEPAEKPGAADHLHRTDRQINNTVKCEVCNGRAHAHTYLCRWEKGQQEGLLNYIIHPDILNAKTFM